MERRRYLSGSLFHLRDIANAQRSERTRSKWEMTSSISSVLSQFSRRGLEASKPLLHCEKEKSQ